MNSSPSPYQTGFISAKSRRLRTFSIVLLVFVFASAMYGMRVLMPTLNANIVNLASPAANNAITDAAHPQVGQPVGGTRLHYSARNRRVLRVQVLFMYAYWSVWVLLVLTLMVVLWLDLREVQRMYLEQRRRLWANAAAASAMAAEQSGRHDADAGSGPDRA